MSDNKIVRFDDKLKEFIDKKVKVECVNKGIKIGKLISWDLKHQSILLETKMSLTTGLMFIRGSEISSIIKMEG